ncbi:MAG: hypothetical protein ABI543_07470 [Ignavibacteria bacterium]
MLKTSINNFRWKKPNETDSTSARAERSSVLYSENLFKENLVLSLKARILAFGIFLYYFIENGTMGLVPSKFYLVYRSIRISELLLYGMVIYSLFYWKEYKSLFKSKSFLIAKIFFAYLIFEFGVSYLRYDFNPIEYFFRLKGIWISFLVFPYMLLISRNGLPFLIKLIFPVAIISNLLYIITALTGIPFLPDVSIIMQQLPGDIQVFRVFGGTFYGEIYFLGIVYFWITKRFRLWQMGLVALFLIPHILAFGRLAWVNFSFTIIVMVVVNSMNKRNYQILLRQAVLLIVMLISITYIFIKFIPESDFYMDALTSRIFQGQDDVKHDEGTYGTRVNLQNSSLVYLWMNSDIFLGVGFHPMWVVGPDSREESIIYGAFSDVSWPAVLAAYGLIGLMITIIIQFYFMFLSFKIIRYSPNVNLFTFFVLLFFARLVFDSTIGFSFIFVSTGLWGFFGSLNIFVPVLVYVYEDYRKKGILK